MSSERIPAYKDADVTCFLEKTDGVLFIHVDVKHWSVGVYKKFKRILMQKVINICLHTTFTKMKSGPCL